MTIKEVFDKAENGTLTWEQFQAAMGTAKFVDLTEGHYVSKQKYDDDISNRDTQITTLNTTIQTRDNDLATLQQTIKDAGDIDALKQASQDLADLRQRYDTETKQYQKQLRQQAYEFAVTEYVNGLKFTSKAAKNDFKKRYAGSTMGRVWAFVQPVVTVLMYYCVFGLIFPARAQLAASGIEAPYVLWLTAGLVPWFYFSEAIGGGTSALIEYNYLVKKVVFKISILPIIKVIAATFIHVFFVFVMLILYFIYGYKPSIYLIQLVYYSFCMFFLCLAISYSTCAIVVFFKDLSQIIGIALQVGMWATPILWEIGSIPEKYRIFFKLNPVFYIVNGYRSALFERQWFFEDFYSTMFFWITAAIIFGIGALIFKRLKPHFADVL